LRKKATKQRSREGGRGEAVHEEERGPAMDGRRGERKLEEQRSSDCGMI
jgi:hypothetical protein